MVSPAALAITATGILSKRRQEKIRPMGFGYDNCLMLIAKDWLLSFRKIRKGVIKGAILMMVLRR